VPLTERIGIHLGEVVIEQHAAGPKAKDLYGIQIDACARVMSLAKGGQVLMTRGVLERKLGEGGFGEVWLGRNPATREARVFKFCFQADRVRFLKRELTLFRLLKERVGDHPHLVRLHDVFLDQPPFCVEMDYVDGADLRSWAAGCGGIALIPLETRLEIVAQAATGLQAAHEAGVIHRDVKPANILVATSKSDIRSPRADPKSGSNIQDPKSVTVKLTDFGIGQIVSEEDLQGITRAGFTQTILTGPSSSGTGTHLYMAPELLAGKAASIRADIYSLAVRSYVPDLDEVPGLTLQAGCNVLVFKVGNMTGSWQGSIRFTDTAGEPIRNVRVTLAPP
jgi:serine/threonine protein kinase